jgi:predicted dehydrogenase
VDELGEETKTSLDEISISKGNSANNPAAISSLGHSYLIADMIEAITNDSKPYITLEEGKSTVDVILAIYQSSREKRAITLL